MFELFCIFLGSNKFLHFLSLKNCHFCSKIICLYLLVVFVLDIIILCDILLLPFWAPNFLHIVSNVIICLFLLFWRPLYLRVLNNRKIISWVKLRQNSRNICYLNIILRKQLSSLTTGFRQYFVYLWYFTEIGWLEAAVVVECNTFCCWGWWGYAVLLLFLLLQIL